MLVEQNPRLFSVDLAQTGSSSTYRGVDFRKPVARYFVDDYAPGVHRLHDFPVFNGRYSTHCYMRTVSEAVDAMIDRVGATRLDDATGIFMHRPYEHMPVQAMSMVGVRRLAATEEGRARLAEHAAATDVPFEALLAEIAARPDLFETARSEGIDADPHPLTTKILKAYRGSEDFKRITTDKMGLGRGIMRQLGNLYSAALPAWLGAGLEEAAGQTADLTGKTWLAIGYGSGDAAECWPLTIVPDWKTAAGKLGFEAALADPVDLDKAAYEGAHDGNGRPRITPKSEFLVDRVGESVDPTFQDVGIEYYRFAS